MMTSAALRREQGSVCDGGADVSVTSWPKEGVMAAASAVCAVTRFSRRLRLFSPQEEPVEIILTLILAAPRPHLALLSPFSMK